MPRPIRADEEAPLPALRDRVEGPAERIKTGGRRTTGRTRGGSPALLRPFGQQFNTVAALLPLPSAPGQPVAGWFRAYSATLSRVLSTASLTKTPACSSPVSAPRSPPRRRPHGRWPPPAR